jgi:hypothetical protein
MVAETPLGWIIGLVDTVEVAKNRETGETWACFLFTNNNDGVDGAADILDGTKSVKSGLSRACRQDFPDLISVKLV